MASQVVTVNFPGSSRQKRRKKTPAPKKERLTEAQRRYMVENSGLVGKALQRVHIPPELGITQQDMLADGFSYFGRCILRYDPNHVGEHGKAKLSTYVYAGVLRSMFNQIRGRVRHQRLFKSHILQNPPRHYYNPEPSQLELEERHDLVRRMIASIPDEDRDAFIRHVVDGEKIRDIVGRARSLAGKRRRLGERIRDIKARLKRQFAGAVLDVGLQEEAA